MKKLISIKNLLIAILLVVIVAYLVKDCSNTPNDDKTEIIIDTVFQDVKTETKVYVPKWRTRVETVEIPYQINAPDIPFDTAALLKDYFSKYATIDTVKLPYGDSTDREFGYGVIYDTISQNTIIARKIFWNYKIPTIKQTIIIHDKPRTQVYAGVLANVNSVQILSSVAGSILLKTKKDHIYSANIGVADNGLGGAQPFIGIGTYWKIRLKKPKPTDLLKITK
jgi:hypothetical protein